MRYIDPKDYKPIISDFDDEISSFEDAVEEQVDFSLTEDDFKTLEEKVLFYIQSNPNAELVHQVQNIIKPTSNAIANFKNEVIKITKASEEYNEIFKDDHDLVVFIRRNIEFNPSAINDFVEYEKQCGFNDMQIAYLRELLCLFLKTDILIKQIY